MRVPAARLLRVPKTGDKGEASWTTRAPEAEASIRLTIGLQCMKSGVSRVVGRGSWTSCRSLPVSSSSRWGIVFLLVGLIGLVVRVVREMQVAAGEGVTTLDVPDLGAIISKVLEAMAAAPAHVLSLFIGLVLIVFGANMLGVQLQIPGMGGNDSSPSPSPSPTTGSSPTS